MYLKRKIDAFLEEWKADGKRKPLIVKGSRQIGKTESILHFAANHYENIIEINFVRDEKYKGIISDGYEASDIIKNISLLDPSRKFVPGKTLIFFDEITEFPEIATSLKFFCIDGRFDVICSGSMLGVNYKRIESNSVGYKKDYEMFSMDFEEFLWAKGYGDDTVQSLLSHMKELTPFSALEMNVFHSLFLDYNILGGMPAVVREYIERNTLRVLLIYRNSSLQTTRKIFANMRPVLIRRGSLMYSTVLRRSLQERIKNSRFQKLLPVPDSGIIADVRNGSQMPVWSISVIAWNSLNCRWAAIMNRINSSCISPIRVFWFPCWTMNRRRISEPIKTLEYIRELSMRIWSGKLLSNKVISCSIIKKKIQPWRRIFSSEGLFP